jgi:hypothetical protein
VSAPNGCARAACFSRACLAMVARALFSSAPQMSMKCVRLLPTPGARLSVKCYEPSSSVRSSRMETLAPRSEWATIGWSGML